MIERPRFGIVKKLGAAVALVGIVVVVVVVTGTMFTEIFGDKTRQNSQAQSTLATGPLAPPPENIRPLPVRAVQEARVSTPGQCSQQGPQLPVAPVDVMNTCDLVRTTAYVLGPQVSELQLTHVETMKSPTSDFHVVRFSLQPASASAFATYTAGHIGEQLAFVRDGVVLFAPKITQAINSQTLEISGDLTAQQADDVARMLRQPA